MICWYRQSFLVMRLRKISDIHDVCISIHRAVSKFVLNFDIWLFIVYNNRIKHDYLYLGVVKGGIGQNEQ